MTDKQVYSLFREYLETRRHDGRQIHPQTGTIGYDEEEWEAFQAGIAAIKEKK